MYSCSVCQEFQHLATKWSQIDSVCPARKNMKAFTLKMTFFYMLGLLVHNKWQKRLLLSGDAQHPDSQTAQTEDQHLKIVDV